MTPDPSEATAFKDPIPYGIDSWYPVLRGGDGPVVFADAADGRAPRRVAQAWQELPEGGRVVLQAMARPGARPDLSGLERTLTGTGSVERFVAVPGAGDTFTLLPLLDAASVRGGLPLVGRGTTRGRAKWGGVGLFAPLGLPRRLGHPELAIWTKGGPRDEFEDLAVLPVAGSVAVAVGSPGRNQKVIVRGLDRRGTARAILKVGFNGRSDDSVEREARALERLAADCPGRAPHLIASGERNGRCWLAQEALEGSASGEGITNAHADLLLELSELERDDLPLESVLTYRRATAKLRELEPSFDPDWHEEYSALADALRDSSEDATFPVHFGHGDFAPWNLVSSGGQLRAYDWEYFSHEAPALHDLIHFHVQTGVLGLEHPGERVFDELDRLFAGPGSRVVEALGVERDDVLRLTALYVLGIGVSNEVLERLRPTPHVETGRLRRAHVVLCRRLAGLLKERRLPTWTRTSGRKAA